MPIDIHPLRGALKPGYLPALLALLLGACAHEQPLVMRPPPPELVIHVPVETIEELREEIDRMADVPGDRMLPALSGRVEQIDCRSGVEDLHARMALEVRGGQVASFAYYSKRRPRTCSMDMRRDDPFIKWRLTPEGATRVQTPQGLFLIRTSSEAWEFEFLEVERQKFCGMEGHINGRMIIKRRVSNPECSVTGLLDRDEEDLADAPDPAQVLTVQGLRR
ncbi:MAG: hypothetical protein KF771_03955 [Burkholderiales bacterium]|nr:hypothetical protein [Burkholderiales bacterium]